MFERTLLHFRHHYTHTTPVACIFTLLHLQFNVYYTVQHLFSSVLSGCLYLYKIMIFICIPLVSHHTICIFTCLNRLLCLAIQFMQQSNYSNLFIQLVLLSLHLPYYQPILACDTLLILSYLGIMS